MKLPLFYLQKTQFFPPLVVCVFFGLLQATLAVSELAQGSPVANCTLGGFRPSFFPSFETKSVLGPHSCPRADLPSSPCLFRPPFFFLLLLIPSPDYFWRVNPAGLLDMLAFSAEIRLSFPPSP